MDDFETAVLIGFNYRPDVAATIKEQANTYLSEIKQSPACWQLCVERFPVTIYPEVKFWCLQTLHEAIRSWYRQYDGAASTAIKAALTTWLQRDSASASTAVFLKNKLAQTIVAVVQHEFPGDWPSFFTDLIGALAQGGHMVDMFCRILNAIDEDIISLEIPRSHEESQLSMRVKDAMRETCIGDIAAAWYRTVSSLASTQPVLAAAVLDTMHRYVHWIDIGLVANDQFVPLLLSLLDVPNNELKAGACNVLNEIVTKRMEATAKLSLVRQLRILPIMSRWAGALALGPAGEGELEEAGVKMASLLSATALEVLDSLKKVENSAISLAAVGLSVDEEAAAEVSKASGAAAELLAELVPAALKAFRCGDTEAAHHMLSFLLAYVAWMKLRQKRAGGLGAVHSAHLGEMLEGIAWNARYPTGGSNEEGGALSGLDLVAAREEVEEVEDKRRELFTLLKNISRLGFNEALTFVARKLQDMISRSPACIWQEVEVAVVLLHELGEGAPEEALQLPAGPLAQAALALMQAQLPCAGHRLVALAVMEAHVRYCRLLQQEQRAIPVVVATFLDARGMGHPSQDVSTRACYLFSRLAKTLKTPLRPHLASMLSSLEPHLARVAATPLSVSIGATTSTSGTKGGPTQPGSTVLDDRLYVFEAAGQLLGQEEVGQQQQAAALSSLLQTLSAQVERSISSGGANGVGAAARAAAPGLVLQALEATTRLAKGFKADLVSRRKHLGVMFVGALEVAMHAPAAFLGNRAIRTKCISFVHRLVEVLSTDILPVLPSTLEVLMQGANDAPAVEDISGLLQQLAARFRDRLAPLLAVVLPLLLVQAHRLLGQDWDWSGAAARGPQRGVVRTGGPTGAGESGVVATLEDVREKGDLQKAYYGLLHSVAHNQLVGVLMQLPPNVLDPALGALSTGACSHVDPSVRRTCLQVWQALVRECTRVGASIPAFKQFAIEHLSARACITQLLTSDLDIRDAASIGLLGDASATLVVVHQAYGLDLLAHLRGVLSASQVPVEAQQRLLQCVGEGDVKKLKDVLRAMLQAVGKG